MSYSYVLQEDAQNDYETSLKWYAERSMEVAENFIKAVDEAISSVCEYPYM
jgi:plasmid stabilization system protein ParE